MAVRIKLDEGPDLVIRASLGEVSETLAAALKSGEPIRVKIPDGTFELRPERVVSVTNEPEPAEANGAQSAPRRAVPA